MKDEKKGFNIADIIGAVSELNTGAEGREQLKYIDFEKIHPDPGNFYSLDGVEELAGNIELIGLQQPLRVRPDPENEGEYIIVSGHRRRAAIELLVKDGKDAFRLVPCLIEGHQESDAMRELRLILANSSTRKLTSADLATQAQKVEELLYKLKEEGTEFPGRMRDHVAEVCQVQASRLARLKVIRENLTGKMMEAWEAGTLNEDCAYKLARMDENFRNQIWAIRGGDNWDFHGAAAVEAYRGRLEAIYSGETADAVPCGLKACDNRTRRAGMALQYSFYSTAPCFDCCGECPNLATCPNACPHLADKIEVLKSQRAAAKTADKKRLEQVDAKRKAQMEEAHRFAAAGWKRLGDALDRSGKSALWLCERMDWDQDEEEMDAWTPLLKGETPPAEKSYQYWSDDHPFQDMDIKEMADLADDLGVSLDYLCGRTDEPGMAKRAPESAPEEVSPDAKPRWQTGQPLRSGPYYCLVECEGRRLSMKLNWRDSYHEWYMRVGGNLAEGCKVVGWWPLPEDDPEDTEDAEDAEEDDEGDMDALWYGHEDDDDYLAESGEVLGADE